MFRDKLRLLILFLCLSPSALAFGAPLAVGGVLDLRAWDMAGDPVDLSGCWSILWGRLILPGEGSDPLLNWETVRVPSSWRDKRLNQKNAGAETGTATYKLKILLPADPLRPPQLALQIREVRSAFQLYANGQLIASQGTPGIDLESEKPHFYSGVSILPAASSSIDLVLLVSNFHDIDGGILAPMTLGTPADLLRGWNLQLIWQVVVMGALLFIGFYHITLLILRPSEHSYFFFVFFCLIFGTKAGFDGPRAILLLFPQLDYLIYLKIWVLQAFLAGPAYLWYLRSLYPVEMKTWIVVIFTAVLSLYSGLVLLTPPSFFLHLNDSFYFIAGLLILVSFIVMGKAATRHREGALSTLLCGGLLGGLVANDILLGGGLITSIPLAPTGLLIFLVNQSYHLGRKFAQSYRRIASLTEELLKNNQLLESRVLERTRELEKKVQEIQVLSSTDSLTSLANRRKMQEELRDEIKRSERTGRAFGVIMMDIDHFKKINDTFGHIAGDLVLQTVAQLLRESLRKTDLAARWGGEEFLILLPETECQATSLLAERMRERIESACMPHGHQVTASFGWTCWQNKDLCEDLISGADRELYSAKENGRNQVSPVSACVESPLM